MQTEIAIAGRKRGRPRKAAGPLPAVGLHLLAGQGGAGLGAAKAQLVEQVLALVTSTLKASGVSKRMYVTFKEIAELYGVSENHLRAKLPDLVLRGFPTPDPGTGRYPIASVCLFYAVETVDQMSPVMLTRLAALVTAPSTPAWHGDSGQRTRD